MGRILLGLGHSLGLLVVGRMALKNTTVADLDPNSFGPDFYWTGQIILTTSSGFSSSRCRRWGRWGSIQLELLLLYLCPWYALPDDDTDQLVQVSVFRMLGSFDAFANTPPPHTSPNETPAHFGQSTSSLWIKMTSSWICAFLYLWTLIAPILLGQWRDFS